MPTILTATMEDAMPKCDCQGQLVPFGDAEAEVEGFDLQDGALTADVRVYRPCGNCGSELAETTFNIEESVEEEHACDNTPGQHTHYGVNENGDGLVLCKHCGLEFDLDAEHWCDGLKKATGQDEQITLEDVDADVTDRYQTTKTVATTKAEKAAGKGDYKDKPINSRYQRRFLGAEVTFHLKCHRCGETFEITDKDEAAASDYELNY
jgi:hypothetical protein